jgi:N-acetyl-anhydromuramyl-L-alanine amidase AmpD
MKKKLILIFSILIIALTGGWFLINKISQEPIEIIVDKEIPPSKEGVKGVEENLDQPEKTEEEIVEKNIPIEKDFDQKTISKNQEEQKIPITTEEDSFIINKKVNWGYTASSQRNINTIIIHSSYDALGDEPYDLNGLIKEYQQYGVAPHFLINRKGNVYRLVDEKNIAYHAGISKMPDGRTSVNNFSIGIELMNTKDDDYTKNQYSSLNELIGYLENQYNIKYVLGHQDISPDRKTDPWNFDWKEIRSNKSIHN